MYNISGPSAQYTNPAQNLRLGEQLENLVAENNYQGVSTLFSQNKNSQELKFIDPYIFNIFKQANSRSMINLLCEHPKFDNYLNNDRVELLDKALDTRSICLASVLCEKLDWLTLINYGNTKQPAKCQRLLEGFIRGDNCEDIRMLEPLFANIINHNTFFDVRTKEMTKTLFAVWLKPDKRYDLEDNVHLALSQGRTKVVEAYLECGVKFDASSLSSEKMLLRHGTLCLQKMQDCYKEAQKNINETKVQTQKKELEIEEEERKKANTLHVYRPQAPYLPKSQEKPQEKSQECSIQ